MNRPLTAGVLAKRLLKLDPKTVITRVDINGNYVKCRETETGILFEYRLNGPYIYTDFFTAIQDWVKNIFKKEHPKCKELPAIVIK